MTEARPKLSDPLLHGLACASLHPKLHSILILDSTLAMLQATVAALAFMLKITMGKRVAQVTLGSGATEDDLWGSFTIHHERQGLRMAAHQGLLTQSQDDTYVWLVFLPDLSRMSLATARACVMMIDAEGVSLERHGQQRSWSPEVCWLAGCASDAIGQVSSHVLDRFAVRLSGQPMGHTERKAEIRTARRASLVTPHKTESPSCRTPSSFASSGPSLARGDS